MNRQKQRVLRVCVLGFFFSAVLLGVLMRNGTASAACGPVGSASAKNTACGTGTLASDTTGTRDSAFGYNALHFNTTGSDNTASGYGALYTNTTGSWNTASGYVALASNTIGNWNAANGYGALGSNTTGYSNTASGYNALGSNTVGYQNTATGFEALFGNTGGLANTATGFDALVSNSTGDANTASGYEALFSNTVGSDNSASGVNALYNNTVGDENTATGFDALYGNTGGIDNTASGFLALVSNSTGIENTASGAYTLYNTTGDENTASGFEALFYNTGGFANTANGVNALDRNTTGRFNIGLGYNAGINIVAGSNNIDIGGAGTGDESNTIRIGINGTQTATYIAGISAAQVTDNVVEVNSNGQLGIAMSSARYKRDIHDMGGASGGLMKLRPVTFRYKSDPSGTLEYGLVAEEVQRVYPNLVTYGPDGKLQSVRYLEFTALLLNEVQKQQAQLATQQREIDALKQQNASINALSARLAALEQRARTAYPVAVDSLARK